MKKSILSFLFISFSFFISAQVIDSIIDIRDDQIYKVVKIGEQWWMRENLNIGNRIDGTQDADSNGVIEKYCYDNLESNCDIYGGLYQWNEAMDYNPSDNLNPGTTRGICPVGWYLPTDNQWKELEMFLGMSQSEADDTGWRGTDEGGKLKETGISHWEDPNNGATNESGFTALPGGYRASNKSWNFNGAYGFWWSSTMETTDYPWSRQLGNGYTDVTRLVRYMHDGYSIRCILDTSHLVYLTIWNKKLEIISKLNFTDNHIIDTIIIYNSGAGQSISITSIQTNTSTYILNKSSGFLSPGDSMYVTTHFNPPAGGIQYLDTIRIESDDPFNPVILVPLCGYLKSDSIIDIRDSQVYSVVKIGQQWWMQENLNIGIMIDSTQDASENVIIEKYCTHNSDSLCINYGGLYQWNEMMNYNPSDNRDHGMTMGICLAGWHIPTKNEYIELIDFLGGEVVAGGKLKDTGTIHWITPNTGATNESGFSALPVGRRMLDGEFFTFGYYGNWWSATEKDFSKACGMYVNYYFTNVFWEERDKKNGYSVRCLRDSYQSGYLTFSDKNLNAISELEFTDNRTMDTMVLINSSVRNTIHVESIHTNTSIYNFNRSSAVLSPGDSIHLKVSFNPPEKGVNHLDTLRIESDDPYCPQILIPLSGFLKPDSIIDIRDDQIYKIVKIGRQWWMQENLNIGTMINGTQDPTNNGIKEKYCNDNLEANCDIYGGLYQWAELMDYNPSDNENPGITRGICPFGWHLPTENEWIELIEFLGGYDVAGGKLKETGIEHWLSLNIGATNESGFTALPGGTRTYYGEFGTIGYEGLWWSATEENTASVWGYGLDRHQSDLLSSNFEKKYGFSVRCLRDSCQFSYLTVMDKNYKMVSDLSFYGDLTEEELIIINSSAGKTINISSIYTNNPAYNLDNTSANLSPGDFIQLTIYFDPTIKDIYLDTLFIENNDPYNSLITIPLNGTFPPEITFTDSTNIPCFGYADGSATVTPSLGTPPYQYLWDDPGNTTDSIVTGLKANIYYHVTITDSLGWTVTDSIILSQPLLLISQITDSTNISCFGYSDGSAVITPSGGTAPYTYIWDDPAGTTDSTVTGLVANQCYHVTVNDAHGCTITDSVILSQPDMLLSSVTDSSDISCFGFSDGSATITVTGGTRSYSYLWDDQAETKDSVVSGLQANQYYHVSINDALGCIVTDSVMLSQPGLLTIDITDSSNISCFSGSDGTALVSASGGTLPYTYSWDNPEQSTEPVAAGLSANIYYHVTVTDAHSCPGVADSVILSQPPLLVIDITDSTNISCHGFSDGTATITPSGGTPPYTYQWDDPGNTIDSVVTGLSANKYYQVNVTDDKGCSIKDSVMLSEPDPLEINPTYSDTICLYSSDGFISTNPSGGTSPYGYTWSNDATTQSLTGLEAGDYSVKVTDSHGCKDSASFTIHPAVPYSGEQICIVTVDLLTGNNLVIWEKTPGKGIEYYRLYRENTLMGTVGYDDLSIFEDTVADPEKRPYLYKISVVDTCGNESNQSPYHKPLFLHYVSSDVGVNLEWSKYEIEGEIISFNSYSIYRGSDSTALSPLEEDIPTEVDVYTDNDPNALARKYFYRVAGILTDPCIPTGAGGKKADSGPYSHSMSNIEDNRLQETPEGMPHFRENECIIIPNPFSETATLMFHNPEGHTYTLYIMDLSGKVCRMTENINTSEYVLKKEELKEGFYFIELRGPEIYRGKIIIE